MLAEIQCDYFTGMFQNDPAGEETLFSVAASLETVCHHEAAHAVAMYAMDYLLESVGVCANYGTGPDGSRTVGYTGLARSRGPRGQVSVDFDYRPMHFRLGVTFAAGPVGERRHCIEMGKPLRLLGGTEGDHKGIDCIVRTLFARDRDGYAFQRLVWRAAQRVICMPSVWEAITEVGTDLFYTAADADDTTDGDVWSYIEPRDVYRICRRHGVTRGMLLPKSGDRFQPIFPARAA